MGSIFKNVFLDPTKDPFYGNLGSGPTLPRAGLLERWVKDGSGNLVATVGLSAADYLSIDPSLRSIFFSDAETKRDDATIVSLALASGLLNIKGMIGNSETILLYHSSTPRSTLNRALRDIGLSSIASLYSTPSGYLGNGTSYISIPGILTTDTISAQTTDQPTCTIDGRLDIATGNFVCGIRVARDGQLIAFFPCAELAGPIAYNAYRGTKRLPDGFIIGDTMHSRSASGFDLLSLGYEPIAIQRRAV